MKDTKDLIIGKNYYIIGYKGKIKVNVPIFIREIHKDSVYVQTCRNDVPDSHQTEHFIPIDTIKFYPMKNRCDYKVLNYFRDK